MIANQAKPDRDWLETRDRVNFTFTISMLGTDGRQLYFGEYTWTDLFRKRLRMPHIHYGVSTMRRTMNYNGRGFYAFAGTMRDVAQGVIDSPTDQPISVD